MKNTWIIAGVIVVVAAAVSLFLFWNKPVNTDSSARSLTGQTQQQSSPTVSESGSASPTSAPSSTTSPTQGQGGNPQTETFTVTAASFSFTPAEIRVKRGDIVVIKLENTGGFHDWVLDEFNVRTPKINGGESSTVQFTADKTGTFEYYCSVGTHRQMGMKGNLVVME